MHDRVNKSTVTGCDDGEFCFVPVRCVTAHCDRKGIRSIIHQHIDRHTAKISAGIGDCQIGIISGKGCGYVRRISTTDIDEREYDVGGFIRIELAVIITTGIIDRGCIYNQICIGAIVPEYDIIGGDLRQIGRASAVPCRIDEYNLYFIDRLRVNTGQVILQLIEDIELVIVPVLIRSHDQMPGR